jgi:protein-S-isoprenylcysteine O-methyltransferase Ste14
MRATLQHIDWSELRRAGGSVLLAVLWAVFAYRHVVAYVQTGHLSYVVFCVSETLQAALFVLRFRPATVSTRAADWIIAVGATFAPLFFVPHADGLGGSGQALVVAGALLQILGLLSLNRSFAIVPAKRRIRTGGMYRIVRHPVYAAYVIMFSGYVWANTTPWNVALYCLIVASNIARIANEEKHLGVDAEYRAYADRVRYRLVPLIY